MANQKQKDEQTASAAAQRSVVYPGPHAAISIRIPVEGREEPILVGFERDKPKPIEAKLAARLVAAKGFRYADEK